MVRPNGLGVKMASQAVLIRSYLVELSIELGSTPDIANTD